jgi:restriction system protein
MTVPGFQDIMLPLLQFASDGQEHTSSASYSHLSDEFNLSDQDRAELLPSGRQAKFDNRVGWARTHLSKAGLLETTGRGKFRITDEGQRVLAESPPFINMAFLKERYPSYRAFLGYTESAVDETDQETVTAEGNPDSYSAVDAPQFHLFDTDTTSSQTPDELLEAAYEQLNKALAQDLLERVQSMTPPAFENLVIDLLLAMGYGSTEGEVRRSIKGSDEGIDGFVSEDRLGFGIIYVQAKRWADRKVTRENLQAFIGAMAGQGGNRGVFVTTSTFTSDAQTFARSIKHFRVILIDGSNLTRLMINYNLGVSDKRSFVIKAVDSDYFGEE